MHNNAATFPFRFVNGKIAQQDKTTENYAAQLIAATLQTRIGELPLAPQFGSLDPAFSSFNTAGFISTVTNYVTGVVIDDVQQTIGPDGKIKIVVQFQKV
jgi:hypothetical protein